MTRANFRIPKMSVPDFPCKIYFPEETFQDSLKIIQASLKKITKSINKLRGELRSDLTKSQERNQTMFNYMFAQIQSFKLQMQPQAVPVSDIFLYRGYFPEAFCLI